MSEWHLVVAGGVASCSSRGLLSSVPRVAIVLSPAWCCSAPSIKKINAGCLARTRASI
jgi:hypothetical protein